MKTRLLLILFAAFCALSSYAFVVGDANGDGKIDVADITAVASKILGNNPESFNQDAADANQDGKIDVADITTIACIILKSDDVDDNTVVITYNGSNADVKVAKNIASYLTPSVDGANVTITADESLDTELTYKLSGASENGSFTLNSSCKCIIELNGVALTAQNVPAVDIEDGKKISIVVSGENAFADTDANTGKAAFYVKGHAEIEGDGVINITGNAKHAYSSKEYTQLKKKFTGSFNILASASDGIHVGQYYQQNQGQVVISNIAGDGIQVEAAADGEDNDGCVIFKDGSLDITVTGIACDGIKADSLVNISGGTIKIVNNGGAEYNTKKEKVSGSACISGSAFKLESGDISLRATGAGGKGISVDESATFTGGKTEVVTLGDVFEANDDDTKPQAIKSDLDIIINSGEVYTYSLYGKGFSYDDEGTGRFYINGGTALAVGEKKSETNGGTQVVQTFTKQKITEGNTYEFGGVSFTVPAGFNHSSAKIMTSKAE